MGEGDGTEQAPLNQQPCRPAVVEVITMRKHPVSPNQLSLWSRFELLNGREPEVDAWSVADLWQACRVMLLVVYTMLWTAPTTRRARNHHGMIRWLVAVLAPFRAGQRAISG
jgi:hypothetical protein